jgi:hypothetical protein
MNLAWLAAVLRPRDVALHPDFDDQEVSSGPAYLAAVVLGEPWRFAKFHDKQDPWRMVPPSDPAITYVLRTFDRETLAQGVGELTAILEEKNPPDISRNCALALLACCAAAELDDYDTCFALLDGELHRTTRGRTPDDRLIQAVLLQQKSLRLRDSGRAYKHASLSALELLANLQVDACTPFILSSSASWPYQETLAQIVAVTRDAAYSLLAGIEFEGSKLPALVPPRRDRMRAPSVEYLLNVDQRSSITYSDFVEQLFEHRLKNADKLVLGVSRTPDLFYSTLALEIAGHGGVYQARKELAQLRFVEASIVGDVANLDDAVRLFRHAASKKDLDLALRWLRTAGPLDGLSADARKVIRLRLQPERLRSVELRVLVAAAELLTEREADLALDAVFACLAAGGPHDLPGEWELEIIRVESAWRAAAALANAAGRVDDVAELLFSQITGIESADQLRDQAIARSAQLLEWDGVDAGLKERWADCLLENAQALPATVSVMAPVLGVGVIPSGNLRPDLDSIATRLNASMRGSPIEEDIIEAAIPLVRRAMSETRESAVRGSYSVGSPTADIVAGLILYAGVDELWIDLAEFLTDTTVPRADRSPAFERLAREATEVPSAAKEHFIGNALTVLGSPDRLFVSAINPYPEALRFLGRFNLITDEQLLDLTARLAGIPYQGRQEAAKTIATLSRGVSSPWILAFAIQLSYDEDVEARASAGRCLAALSSSSSDLALVSSNHLVDLLKEDGLLVPILILRELENWRVDLTESIRAHVEWMRDNHPSRAVRRLAGRVGG